MRLVEWSPAPNMQTLPYENDRSALLPAQARRSSMRFVAWSARTAALAVLVALAAAGPAAAQQTSSEVSGYVKDSQGAMVPGATVTVTYPAINTSRSAV